MAPVFSRNAILVGKVDNLCLVCETHLRGDVDTIIHIIGRDHQRKLEAIQYVEEFKVDKIKKIKNKYFCELCNKILSLIARVRWHITEQVHIDNRTSNVFKRVGNFIIAFEEVVICEQSWNSLNENSCAICDTEYDNEDIHKTEPAHALNLIQTEVEFDSDKNLYRKLLNVDQWSFHCLTCNLVSDIQFLNSHFADNEHKQKYQLCCDAKSSIDENNLSFNEPNNSPKYEDTKPVGVIKDVNEVKVLNETKEIVDNANAKYLCDKINDDIKVEVSKVDGQINAEVDAPVAKVPLNIKVKAPEVNEQPKKKEVEVLDLNEHVNKKPETSDVNELFNSQVKSEESAFKEQLSVKPSTPELTEQIKVKASEGTNKISPKAALSNKDNIEKKNSGYIYDEDCENRICKTLGCKNYITLDEHKQTWCILCDWVMDPQTVKAHIYGKHHQVILKLHKKRAEKLKNKYFYDNHKEETHTEPQAAQIPQDNDKILDNLNEFQKNDININFETNSATCKKCVENIDFNYTAIESHITEHKKKKKPIKKEIKPFDTGLAKVSEKKNTLITTPVLIDKKITISAETLKTDIKEEQQEAKVICLEKKCEVPAGQTLKNDKELVCDTDQCSSIQVYNPKVKKSKTINHVKVPTVVFIKNMTIVDNMIYKDVVINEKYCINFFSLCMMRKLSGRNDMRCEVCEKNFILNDFESHIITPLHSKGSNDTPVIIADDTEFIREIRSGVYHCGYCNYVENSWEDMEAHLKNTSHKEVKTAVSWRLDQYKTDASRNSIERLCTDQLLINEIISKYF